MDPAGNVSIRTLREFWNDENRAHASNMCTHHLLNFKQYALLKYSTNTAGQHVWDHLKALGWLHFLPHQANMSFQTLYYPPMWLIQLHMLICPTAFYPSMGRNEFFHILVKVFPKPEHVSFHGADLSLWRRQSLSGDKSLGLKKRDEKIRFPLSLEKSDTLCSLSLSPHVRLDVLLSCYSNQSTCHPSETPHWTNLKSPCVSHLKASFTWPVALSCNSGPGFPVESYSRRRTKWTPHTHFLNP